MSRSGASAPWLWGAVAVAGVMLAGQPRAGAVPCGTVSPGGCCAGERLYWCEGDQLATIDCGDRPSCGWSDRGQYDCDTAGSADPAGRAALHCDFGGDAGPSVRDGAPGGDASAGADGGCGGVDEVGCCVDEVLVFCDRGQPRAIACGRNPRCGWQSSGQIYNCGTDGRSDPGHPRACGSRLPDIALPPADLGAQDAGDGGPGSATDDGRIDDGRIDDGRIVEGGAGPTDGGVAPGSGDGGCGCAMAASPPVALAAGLLAVGLMALALLGRTTSRGRRHRLQSGPR